MIYRGYTVEISSKGDMTLYSIRDADGTEIIASSAASTSKAETEACDAIDRLKRAARAASPA